MFIKDGFIKDGFIKGDGEDSNLVNIDYQKIKLIIDEAISKRLNSNLLYIKDMISDLHNSISDFSMHTVEIKLDNVYSKLDNLRDNLDFVVGNFNDKFEESGNKFISDFNKNFEKNKTSIISEIKLNQTYDMANVNLFNLNPSLNGAYGSFKDNDFISSTIYSVKLKVLASGLLLNELNNYIIIYKVENENKDIMFLPSMFVIPYVEKIEKKDK
ncbi:hypothetical protein O6B34_01295 [Campylobacter ureolyticus]|uniref:hypothetical protein n=1 Tax=Campylobacter ureolyticus TaxID=827 RepID=UPI0022B58812|nr:hypothetical protein [Campylobacter ureolyticus]MCZ6104715.1 hypothetical protein [Campylobacter ureolyticus]